MGSLPQTSRWISPSASSSSSNQAASRVTTGSLTAQAVADLVGGRLLGDGAVRIHTVGPLDKAGPDALSFAISARYAADLGTSRAAAVLVPEELSSGDSSARARIVVADPYGALVQVVRALFPEEPQPGGIDPTARIGTGTELGPDVSIGPFVVLGRNVRVGARSRLAQHVTLDDGVTVGEDTVIGPGAVCYRGSRIGSRVVLKAGAVIGGGGFGGLPPRAR